MPKEFRRHFAIKNAVCLRRSVGVLRTAYGVPTEVHMSAEIVPRDFLRNSEKYFQRLYAGGISNMHSDAMYDMPRLVNESLSLFPNLTVLSVVLASLVQDRSIPRTKFFIKDSYDYVIVGGGTAGSVMAARLSQKPCVSVLLLEAGGTPPLLTEVPGLARIFFGSPVDWLYQTVPQKYGGFSQRGNMVAWNSGKALGGGTVINALLYVRGNRKNYDNWVREGATGWGYKDVFPYFLKMEDNRNIDELDPGYHRRGGPMTVEKINHVSPIKIPILEATSDMGFEIRDINGRRQTGIYDVQAMLRIQRRCSAAKAYLVPNDGRPNLDIVKGAFVRKIIIENRRAVGVEFDHLFISRTVRARKEVILAAGAVRTAQLLMLSGIGPKGHLEKFNISVIADLPVGKNLMDHNAAAIVYQLSEKYLPIVLQLSDTRNILDYTFQRRGPLTVPNQTTVIGFLNGMNTTSYSRDFPKHEIYFAEYAVFDMLVNAQVRPEVYDEVYKPYELKPVYICYASLLQPKSRGEIRLKSTNPYDYPIIDPRYFEHPSDLKEMVRGLKVCEAVARHPALRKIGARPLDTVYPACRKFLGNENKYLACVAQQVMFSFWHPSGTARMGQPSDPRSVVDPELRVLGVKGLRIVSAAVMPIIPSANLDVPTMMVAEKIYDKMKDDIKCYGKKKLLPKVRTV